MAVLVKIFAETIVCFLQTKRIEEENDEDKLVEEHEEEEESLLISKKPKQKAKLGKTSDKKND